MSDKREVQVDQVFLIEDILPDSSGFFEDEPQELKTAIEEADIVLDTNVLLIPYGAGVDSLSQIVKVYSKIKDRGRLFIPAQVGREFVKNRPNKLAQLYQGISDKISRLTIPETLSYPILESVPEFKELNDKISALEGLKSEAKSSARKVRQVIKEWGWNDPVSKAYRPIFTRDLIVSPKIEREKTVEEMVKRYKQAIPPGYKDASKVDYGIGDFLIWKTILRMGEEHHRNVVFVSGDEKADWLHGAEGSGFLPRYELQAEFRRLSQGHDLYIIPLSSLLELQQAEESSVAEIRTEEKRIRAATTVLTQCPECGSTGEYDVAEQVGSSALPVCTACECRFHLHRTREGITVHRYKTPSSFSREKAVEIVECPYCGAENVKELGLSPSSTAWCICDECQRKFPIHRRSDGTFFANTTTSG